MKMLKYLGDASLIMDSNISRFFVVLFLIHCL